MAQPSDAAQREQARYEDQLAEARERYDALRSRKAACAALALAGLRRRAAALLRHNGHRARDVPSRATPRDAPSRAGPRRWPSSPASPPRSHTAGLWAICTALHHRARRDPSARVWPPAPLDTPGLDWRGPEQVALVRDVLASQPQLVFPTGPTGDRTEYHTGNEMFSRLDAWALQDVGLETFLDLSEGRRALHRQHRS